MGKIKGQLLKIYAGPTTDAVDCQTEASLELTADLIDVSCKDNLTGWGGSIPGTKSGSLSGSGLVITNSVNGYPQLFAAFENDTEIDWKFSMETSGTFFLSGKGFITSLSQSAGVSDAVQFSFTITINSPVVATEIT